MKFEIGDQVLVKHSNEEGRVVEIIDQKMVLVEVRGVRFPAYTDQLDFPYFRQFSQQKKTEASKPGKVYIDQLRAEQKTSRFQVAPGVWLLLFPVFSRDVFDDEMVDELKFFLVNQTQAGLRFHCWLNYSGAPNIDIQNEMYALHDFYLFNIPFENLNDNPSLDFEFSLLTPSKKKAEYFECFYKPKAKQVFRQVESLKEKGESFFAIKLFDEFPDKVELPSERSGAHPFHRLEQAGFRVSKGQSAVEAAPPSVIDLHIEKLTDAYRQMTAHEKLTLQLKEFEKWLDRVAFHYMQHVWVIHGVGSGRLKEEVHEILKHRKDIKSFVSQYHPWYGYGATEIFLQV
jgi:hypothetical protein